MTVENLFRNQPDANADPAHGYQLLSSLLASKIKLLRGMYSRKLTGGSILKLTIGLIVTMFAIFSIRADAKPVRADHISTQTGSLTIPNNKTVLLQPSFQHPLPSHKLALRTTRDGFYYSNDFNLETYYMHPDFIRSSDLADQQQSFGLYTVKNCIKHTAGLRLEIDKTTISLNSGSAETRHWQAATPRDGLNDMGALGQLSNRILNKSFENIILRADMALYMSKANDHNRTVIFGRQDQGGEA